MSKFDPPTRQPVAYGYGRVSHLESFQKGDSLPSQELRIKNYYESNLQPQGIEWGGCETDGKNISAFKVMFFLRPAGKRLMAKLKPGDHLVLDKVDRIWRSLEDFVRLMGKFEAMGITVHIVSFLGSSIQNDTPMGKFMLKQFVLMAELESSIKSERIRESLIVARKKGRRINQHAPAGCRVITRPHPHNPKRQVAYLVWCEMQRTIMNEIVRLIDVERMQWSRAFSHIEEFVAKIERRPVRTMKAQEADREFTWRRMYAYETAYRYLGIRDPSQIPKQDIIKEAARQYKRVRTNERAKRPEHLSSVPAISPQELLNLAASR